MSKKKFVEFKPYLEEMYKSFSEEEKVNVSYAIYSYERLESNI